MDKSYRSHVEEYKNGIHIILDEQTKKNLNIIVLKTNAFLAEPFLFFT